MANILGKLLVELGVNTTSFLTGMNAASKEAKKTGKDIEDAFDHVGDSLSKALGSFGEVGSKLGELGSAASEAIGAFSGGETAIGATIGALAGVGVAAVAAATGLSALAIEGAEIVERFSLISQKTGIGVRDLQVFEAAGKTVGVSLEDMVTAMRKFDTAIAGTGKGSAQAAMVMRELGITSRDNKEALLETADAFKNMADGPQKAADAVALFGRAGLNMIPFLNKGREGVEQFNAVVAEFGPTINEHGVAANEDWEVATTKLNLAWQSFAVGVEGEVLPVLSKLVGILATATKGTGDFIESSLTGFHKIGAAAAAYATALTMGDGKISASQAASDAIDDVDRNAHGGGDDAKGKRQLTEAEKEFQAEQQKSFEIAKAGGEAEYALDQAREKIALLVSKERFQEATHITKDIIPGLERAAELEKQRKRDQYAPVKAAGQAPIADDLLKSLGQQADAQMALAAATDHTAGSFTVLNAVMTANKKIGDDMRKLDDERAKLSKELENGGANLGGPQRASLNVRIKQIDDEKSKLQEAVPEIRSLYAQIATARQIEQTGARLDAATDANAQQIASLRQLAAAYAEGGDAIANAQIEQKLSGEKVAVQKAQEALDAYAAQFPKDAAGIAELTDDLEKQNKALALHRAQLQSERDLSIAANIAKDTQALRAETSAYQLLIDAADKGYEAKARAEAQGAAIKVKSAGGSDSEAELAAEKSLQMSHLKRQQTVAEQGAQLDLNQTYTDRLELITAIADKYKDNSQIQLQLDAQIFDEQNRLNEQWDAAANKVGTLTDRTKALLDQIRIDGTNTWGAIFSEMEKSVQGLTDSLANFVVTGKGSLKQVGEQFETGIVKAGLQNVEGKAAGFLETKLFGGAIGGGKPDGTQSNPLHVSVVSGGVDGSGDAGGLLGKLFSKGDSGDSGGVGGFLSSIFGGGAGATGKPDGSQMNPFYITQANSLASGGGLSSLGGLFGGGGGSDDSSDSGGSSSGFGSVLGAIFSGFRAGGGDVMPGKAYVVGEKRPELFVPGRGGSIQPTVGGGGDTYHSNVQMTVVTPDADSFKRSQTQLMAKAHRQSAVAFARGGA